MYPTSVSTVSRKPGLDLLRLGAAILVFYQHCFSSCRLEHLIDAGPFRIGRIGTSLFFLLAGLLAGQSSRSPGIWFRDRLVTLFPPFWIITLLGFALAGWTHFKPFDSWQVVCQMSGFGYLTHGETMVNVATWFMSPLLLMYLAVMIGRVIHRPVIMASLCVLTALTSSVIQTGTSSTVDCHVVTFFLAFLLRQQSARRWTGLAFLTSLVLTLALSIQPELRYSCVSFGLLGLSQYVRSSNILAIRFTPIAYEWFLVHGLCLTLITRLTHQPTVVIPVAVVLSVSAAIALKTAISWLHVLCRPRSMAAPTRPRQDHIEQMGLRGDYPEVATLEPHQPVHFYVEAHTLSSIRASE